MFQDVEVESEVATKQPPGDYRSKGDSPVRVLWDQLRLGNHIWVFKLLGIKPNQILSFRLMPSSFRQFVIWLLFDPSRSMRIIKPQPLFDGRFRESHRFSVPHDARPIGWPNSATACGNWPWTDLGACGPRQVLPICRYFCYISMYCVFGNVATNSFFFFFGGGMYTLKGSLPPNFSKVPWFLVTWNLQSCLIGTIDRLGCGKTQLSTTNGAVIDAEGLMGSW